MTSATQHNRRTRVDIPEQTRLHLTTALNASLATALDLKLQAKQAHWNVGGMEFSTEISRTADKNLWMLEAHLR